jgi:hypothetical protein
MLAHDAVQAQSAPSVEALPPMPSSFLEVSFVRENENSFAKTPHAESGLGALGMKDALPRMQLTCNFVLQDATSANLMAQLEELNNLAGVVETQTANAVLQTRSNANTLAPQTRVGFESEEERETIYSELKKLLDRREILRSFCSGRAKL